MSARVFISCGQAIEVERSVSQAVAEWFRSQGYQPYVAITVQTIAELNSGILDALRLSDYYLFIDLPRESLSDMCFRGSLYTHQELAMAYVLGFERMILISHAHVSDEGMKKFIISNSPRFEQTDKILSLVQNAVASSEWKPNFSRHLSTPWGRLGETVTYRDHSTPGRNCRVFYVDIQNNRNDMAALHTLCRFIDIDVLEGNPVIKEDFTLLKATGSSGYEHTIWPKSHVAFDVLAISSEDPTQIYLHSSLDVFPRAPLIHGVCLCVLHYEVLAEGFPMHTFSVRLQVGNSFEETSVELVQA